MAETGQKYLIFEMQGKLYAFDLAHLAEVMEPPQLWLIPNAPSYYAGAMNYHGAIVAVLDFRGFLGLKESVIPEKAIVIDAHLAAMAFLVERVLRIVSAVDVQPADTDDNAEFGAGCILLPEGKALLLDVAAIVDVAAERINSDL